MVGCLVGQKEPLSVDLLVCRWAAAKAWQRVGQLVGKRGAQKAGCSAHLKAESSEKMMAVLMATLMDWILAVHSVRHWVEPKVWQRAANLALTTAAEKAAPRESVMVERTAACWELRMAVHLAHNWVDCLDKGMVVNWAENWVEPQEWHLVNLWVAHWGVLMADSKVDLKEERRVVGLVETKVELMDEQKARCWVGWMGAQKVGHWEPLKADNSVDWWAVHTVGCLAVHWVSLWADLKDCH
jgi:hypothetical protein